MSEVSTYLSTYQSTTKSKLPTKVLTKVPSNVPTKVPTSAFTIQHYPNDVGLKIKITRLVLHTKAKVPI